MKWHTFRKRPKAGRKIIALYDDGSGAEVLFTHRFGGIIEGDGNEDNVADHDWMIEFSSWAYLPKGYRLQFELQFELQSDP